MLYFCGHKLIPFCDQNTQSSPDITPRSPGTACIFRRRRGHNGKRSCGEYRRSRFCVPCPSLPPGQCRVITMRGDRAFVRDLNMHDPRGFEPRAVLGAACNADSFSAAEITFAPGGIPNSFKRRSPWPSCRPGACCPAAAAGRTWRRPPAGARARPRR